MPSTNVTDVNGKARLPAENDGKSILFFDIDNCLYSKNCGIAEMMKKLIGAYFLRLGLPSDEAASLHHHYFTEYGLAIRGLVRHHRVDPLDYDKQCDAALPLEDVLKPNPELQTLLKDIDRKKFRVWALTNAYVNHAVRVLRLLGLSEFFEGIVSCDYGAGEFACKPEKEFFDEALVAAGQPDVSKLYFVDDSALNIKGAHTLKWGHVVLFDELRNETSKLGGLEKVELSEESGRVSVVEDMLDLRKVWSEAFVASS